MAEPLEDEQQALAHRYFAAECNNACWVLTTAHRTSAQDEEMLNLAHAAAFHWSVVGETLHHMRADQLLAHVHALLGLGGTALSYARTCHSYFTGRDDTPDWELAFTHAILAQAAFAAGDDKLHASAYAEAQTALQAIADPEDRSIVEDTFALIPAP